VLPVSPTIPETAVAKFQKISPSARNSTEIGCVARAPWVANGAESRCPKTVCKGQTDVFGYVMFPDFLVFVEISLSAQGISRETRADKAY
jgi:hypothetical protein